MQIIQRNTRRLFFWRAVTGDTMKKQYEQYRLVWHRVGESDRAAVPLGNGDYAASF